METVQVPSDVVRIRKGKRQQLVGKEWLDAIDHPYLTCTEIARLIGCSVGAASKVMQDAEKQRWVYGYYVEDVIEAFRLQKFIKRMRKDYGYPIKEKIESKRTK